MLPVVDRDGLTKPVLQIIAEEALESGIEEICFVVGQPFLVLLEDHLYLLAEPRRCARQLIDLAMAEKCAVSAVQAMREHLIHQYGTLTGRRLAERSDVYTIDEIIEKPNPTLAELRLQVPGLRRSLSRMRHSLTAGSPTAAEITSNPFALSHDNHGER